MERPIPGIDELNRLRSTAEARPLSADDRIVIFSDLHMGDGSRNDDFRHNGDLFVSVLNQYYRPNKFELILNGDVEELQRFSWRSISRRWSSVYDAFTALRRETRVTRIVGNHDLELLEGGPSVGFPVPDDLSAMEGGDTAAVYEALRLLHPEGEIFIYHGHQTSWWYQKHNNLVRLLLRYIANPLHIKNATVAEDSRKQFRVERRAYHFATQEKLIAIIGHTHRPLFESMSKADAFLFEIENLCRAYPGSTAPQEIEQRVAVLKEKLIEVRQEEAEKQFNSSLYREHLIVPSVFNSGCALGPRGMTCLEIHNDRLSLVYWYDGSKGENRRQFRAYPPEEKIEPHFHRAVIQSDSLQYIFSRIRLLS